MSVARREPNVSVVSDPRTEHSAPRHVRFATDGTWGLCRRRLPRGVRGRTRRGLLPVHQGVATERLGSLCWPAWGHQWKAVPLGRNPADRADRRPRQQAEETEPDTDHSPEQPPGRSRRVRPGWTDAATSSPPSTNPTKARIAAGRRMRRHHDLTPATARGLINARRLVPVLVPAPSPAHALGSAVEAFSLVRGIQRGGRRGN